MVKSSQPLSLLFYGHFHSDPNTISDDTAKDIRFNKVVVVKSIRVCAPEGKDSFFLTVLFS